MKITVSKQDLKTALAAANEIKPSTILDITKFDLLEFNGQALAISTSNIEANLYQSIPIQSSQLTSKIVLIQTGRILEFINTLSGDEIAISLGKKLNVKQGKARISLAFREDIENYPDVVHFDESLPYQVINAGRLQTAIKQTAFATDETATRLTLTGIHWNENMTATNGYRVSSVSGLELENTALVTANNLKLAKIFDSTQDIQIQATENKLVLADGNRVLSLDMLGGQYPDLAPFLEMDAEIKVSLERVPLLHVLRQANIVAKIALGNIVTVRGSEDGIDLVVETETDSSLSHIECQIDQEFEFMLNCSYFLEAIQSMNSNEVELGITSDNGPIILIGDYKHAIMRMTGV
jgi:DNA polymerase III sliding clamp (beta) subunit (PCNA family)